MSLSRWVCRTILVFMGVLLCAHDALSKSIINVTISVVNGQQRQAYQKLFDEFERLNPNYRVNLRIEAGEAYKQKIESWLLANRHSDVMSWFGGERLKAFINQGWVTNIDDLWGKTDWKTRFTLSGQSSVTVAESFYAVPIHYYHWGLYYRKSLFTRLGLKEPETWSDFIRICDQLKQAGVVPIAIGSKEYWPLAGWFDYLNLRLNGLELHASLVSGQISYHEESIRKVFDYWKALISEGYFLEGHENLTWRDALPYLYRNLAGMMLMGNFWTSQIPDSMREDFSVFRFPLIDDSIGIYEEAPTDVLFIPQNASNVRGAQDLLQFMASASILNTLNNELGMLAPQSSSLTVKDHFLSKGLTILSQADGASQFYDRDNPKPIATEGMKLMQKFTLAPDSASEVIQALDRQRKSSFNLDIKPHLND